MTPEWREELARAEAERFRAETKLDNALRHLAEVQADQIERDRRFRDALPEAMVNMDERLTKLRESAEAAQKAAQKLQAKVAKVEETMSWLELLGNLEALEAALEQRPLETSNVAHYARMELAERMAQAGVGRLPVVAPDDPDQVIGMVTRSDLLKARARCAEEEGRRERFLGFRLAS